MWNTRKILTASYYPNWNTVLSDIVNAAIENIYVDSNIMIPTLHRDIISFFRSMAGDVIFCVFEECLLGMPHDCIIILTEELLLGPVLVGGNMKCVSDRWINHLPPNSPQTHFSPPVPSPILLSVLMSAMVCSCFIRVVRWHGDRLASTPTSPRQPCDSRYR